MECIFKVKATTKDKEICIISADNENKITSIEFKINTVEKNVNDRSSNVLNQIEIKGTLEKDTNEECEKLLKWSCSNDKNSVYRSIQITIKSQNEIIREYDIDNIFCEDYTENFSSSEQGTFTLNLAQRKGYLETIKVFNE